MEYATQRYLEQVKIIHISFLVTQQPVVGQGVLIVEASRRHSITQCNVGRTPVDERLARRKDLSDSTNYSCESEIRVLGVFRTRNPRKRMAKHP
jgi:hypothetical protein